MWYYTPPVSFTLTKEGKIKSRWIVLALCLVMSGSAFAVDPGATSNKRISSDFLTGSKEIKIHPAVSMDGTCQLIETYSITLNVNVAEGTIGKYCVNLFWEANPTGLTYYPTLNITTAEEARAVVDLLENTTVRLFDAKNGVSI